jgi:ribose transport system substrate-binding protein
MSVYGRTLAALTAALSLAVVASGCGGDSSQGTAAKTGTQQTAKKVTTKPPDEGTKAGPGIEAVPQAFRKFWAGYDVVSAGQKLGDSPYRNWTPPKAPWKFCYNQNYLGNGIRQAYVSTYEAQVKLLQKAGLADGPLISTDSNLNTALQISQFNSLIQRGCDVIMYIAPSPTALCKVHNDAFKRGILVISIEQSSPCPNGFAVQDNDYQISYDMATWLADAMGGKGNVVLGPGISSTPATQTNIAAAKDVIAQHPEMKIAGEVETQWNNTVGKTKFQQFLATHPQKLDGVFQEGCCGDLAAAEAFKQSGRPVPLINGFEGPCNWLAYWRDNKLNSFSYVEGAEAEQVWNIEVALRILNGQKPKVNNLMHPAPTITNETLKDWTKPDWTQQSTCYAYPYDSRELRKQYLDQLFEGGKPVDPEHLAPVWPADAPGAINTEWTLG